MTENNDLERYQSMLAQLRAMSDKQMACELECSRLAADNARLKKKIKFLQVHRDQLQNFNKRLSDWCEEHIRAFFEIKYMEVETENDTLQAVRIIGKMVSIASKALEDKNE